MGNKPIASPVIKGGKNSHIAPIGLVLSLLLGIPFLILFLSSMAPLSDILSIIMFQTVLTCFFWRRTQNIRLRSMIPILLIAGQWLSIFLILGTFQFSILHIDLAIMRVPLIFITVIAAILMTMIIQMPFPKILQISVKGFSLCVGVFVMVLMLHKTGVKNHIKKDGLTHLQEIQDLHKEPAVTPAPMDKVTHKSKNIQQESMVHSKDHKSPPKMDEKAEQNKEHLMAPQAINKHFDWSYDGITGPVHWGSLTSQYKKCDTGRRQSPINIKKHSKVRRKGIYFHYKKSKINIQNNGHTVALEVDKGNYLLANGVQYHLVNIHFHTPSEHTVNGVTYPMEMHFVHKDAREKLLVVGTFIEQGRRHKEMQKIWSKMPEQVHQNKKYASSFRPFSLLPKKKHVYQYKGSLTTPPCTEGVRWHVMRNPIELSKHQIDTFRNIFDFNARPVQYHRKAKVAK